MEIKDGDDGSAHKTQQIQETSESLLVPS